jgi:hypothetical protein
MRTQSLLCRPQLFQRIGKTAIVIMAISLLSLTALASWPWFSGYIDPTNSYRIYAFTDWDTSLFGVGIYPDTDCLGLSPPNYRVDGHVVFEADGTGNSVVIESTGTYSTYPGFSVGSIQSVSFQFGGWWQSPSSPPASDTRDDWDSDFLNIVCDPVGVLEPTNATPIPISIGLAASTVAICWPSDTNHNYGVMWLSQLAMTNIWYFLGTTVVGNGTTNTVYDSVTNSSRFYRIISLQYQSL